MAPKALTSSSTTTKLSALESKIVRIGLQAPDGVISQTDLLPKCSITASATTQDAMNSLLRKNLVQMLKTPNGVIKFRIISTEEAKALGSMDGNEKMVLDEIKSAGNKGIWTKHINTNTGLPKATVDKALKALEGRKTVKTVKSVKTPTRKMYMMANLTPSAEITGGPWFTDGALDADFIKQLRKCVIAFLKSKAPTRMENGERRIHPVSATRFLPRAKDVHAFIEGLDVFQVEFEEQNIADILELLVFDGIVEKVYVVSDEIVGPGAQRVTPTQAVASGDKSRKKRSRDRNDEERASRKRQALQEAMQQLKMGLEGDDDDDAESEEFDSDEEDVEADRKRKARSSAVGGEEQSRKRRKNRGKRVKVEFESSAHESESDHEEVKDVKGKQKAEEDKPSKQVVLESFKDHVYRLARTYKPVIGWTDMPCGKCPSETFCSETTQPLGINKPKVGKSTIGLMGGPSTLGTASAQWGEVRAQVGASVAPVNPKDCPYFAEWLDF